MKCAFSTGLSLLLTASFLSCGEPAKVRSLFVEQAGASAATFFDAPYPANVRLTAAGTPDIGQWPVNDRVQLTTVLRAAGEREGFPVMPVGYFRFDGELPARDIEALETRGLEGAFALVDVDPESPERGKTFPVVATVPQADAYTPSNLLAIGLRPGLQLHPRRTYAFVVFERYGDEAGIKLGAPELLEQLARGEQPVRADGPRLDAEFRLLWNVLDEKSIARGSVVAASVFTTGDVVAETAELTDRVIAAHRTEIEALALEVPEEPGTPNFAKFCHYTGTVKLPQFQVGKPVFDHDGLFTIGADGLPVLQREEQVKFSLTIPREPMPEAGYPLVLYFHGSGGRAREFVDGADKNEDAEQLDSWPARVLADKHFAVAGTALPISPDRVKNAGSFDYLNLYNPGAMRDTFRQGVIEQRMLIDALDRLRVPKELLEGCDGASLPAGATEAKFDLSRLSAQGQSMGGMYTNLIAAVEPRIQAAVPTGAGGYWMYFILETNTVGGEGLLKMILWVDSKFTFLSPVLSLIGTALEPIDPIVSASRLSRLPLPGHKPRPIYEPAGKDDSYFPPKIYDAMVLSYGHPRVGEEIWSSMAEAQKLIGLEQPISYPVKNNLSASTGESYTGAVVQYAATGDWDPHSIFRRLPEVRHQYACFHDTFRRTGVGVISAPAAEGTPCAEP